MNKFFPKKRKKKFFKRERERDIIYIYVQLVRRIESVHNIDKEYKYFQERKEKKLCFLLRVLI